MSASTSSTPPRLFPNVPNDGYREAQLAVEAFGILDTFRQLTVTETERVTFFVSDARRRQDDPAENRAYTVLESFGVFAEACRNGDTREQVMQDMALTPNQFDRYERAWQSVQAVFEENER